MHVLLIKKVDIVMATWDAVIEIIDILKQRNL